MLLEVAAGITARTTASAMSEMSKTLISDLSIGCVLWPKLVVLTLILVGFLEYVNWWGGGPIRPPSDLEN